MFPKVLFILSTILALGGAVLVLSLKNIMHACMALLTSLLGVAGLYFSMGADFVGVVQIMVYVGGVVILMLFAVMLTGGRGFVSKAEKLLGLVPSMGSKWSYGIAALTGGALLLVVGRLWARIAQIPVAKTEFVFKSTVDEIGRLLITDHILAFELSSVLLLGALVGAAMISRPKKTVIPSESTSSTGEETHG